ncbi:unnamed protein product [Orchesella dallaii]|uniref:Uncharacterized protein n=1 Tax=Orchesella dallaii TaxID=48710 RepID=A0ABP1Q6K3_9HEXA
MHYLDTKLGKHHSTDGEMKLTNSLWMERKIIFLKQKLNSLREFVSNGWQRWKSGKDEEAKKNSLQNGNYIGLNIDNYMSQIDTRADDADDEEEEEEEGQGEGHQMSNATGLTYDEQLQLFCPDMKPHSTPVWMCWILMWMMVVFSIGCILIRNHWSLFDLVSILMGRKIVYIYEE